MVLPERRGKVGQERSQVESNPSVNMTEEPVNACGETEDYVSAIGDEVLSEEWKSPSTPSMSAQISTQPK